MQCKARLRTGTTPDDCPGLLLQVNARSARLVRVDADRDATRMTPGTGSVVWRRLEDGTRVLVRIPPKPPPSDPTPEEAVAEFGAAVDRALKVQAETRALIARARMFPARPTVTRPMPRVRAVCSHARTAPRPRAARPRAMSRASSRSGDSGDDSSREPDLSPAQARLTSRAVLHALIARLRARFRQMTTAAKNSWRPRCRGRSGGDG